MRRSAVVSKLVYMRESDGRKFRLNFNFRFGGDVTDERCEGKEIKLREFSSLI